MKHRRQGYIPVQIVVFTDKSLQKWNETDHFRRDATGMSAEFEINASSEETCTNAASSGLSTPIAARTMPSVSTNSVPAKFAMRVVNRYPAYADMYRRSGADMETGAAFYSSRNATTGSTRVARIAGM
jgi:hypothetical protein